MTNIWYAPLCNHIQCLEERDKGLVEVSKSPQLLRKFLRTQRARQVYTDITQPSLSPTIADISHNRHNQCTFKHRERKTLAYSGLFGLFCHEVMHFLLAKIVGWCAKIDKSEECLKLPNKT